jgi:hypothetical protein
MPSEALTVNKNTLETFDAFCSADCEQKQEQWLRMLALSQKCLAGTGSSLF